jgi:voltage-gated potassium channel Kch
MSQPIAPGSYFFRGQLAHALMIVILVVGACLLVDLEQLSDRQMIGISVQAWFVIALVVPIVHQVYVWLAWRSQLCFGTVTKRFGDHAFVIYQVVFMFLLLARPVSLTMLAIADHDSLALSVPIRIAVCTILGLPAAYGMYSVVRYFGMARAAGKDHFDANFRSEPLVKQGIFRYTSNAMYAIVFLGVWVIAIAAASWAALVAAGFSHAYIWVHYYCTERPDMKVIYGGGE